MGKFAIALLIAAATTATGHAQTMPVSTFLAKADALQKKGPLALFSGDLRVLKREIENSAKQLRAEQTAATKAGRKPATCMPEKVAMNSNELLAHLRSVPAEQRSVPVKTAFAGLMRKKYPCR